MLRQRVATRAALKNNLVIGIDIRTTYSAVSFFITTHDDKDPVFHEANVLYVS